MQIPIYIRVIRSVNRALSTFIAVFLVVMIAGDPIKPNWNETIALLFFPGGVITGFLWSWKNERWGSIFSCLSLAVFYVYMYARGNTFPSGPYFLLLTFPALVFLVLSVAYPVSKKES